MGRLGGANQVFSVSLQAKLGFFVVAQRDGTVSFYSITGCQFIAYLNQPRWDRGFGRQITKRGGLAVSLGPDVDRKAVCQTAKNAQPRASNTRPSLLSPAVGRRSLLSNTGRNTDAA